MRLQSKKKMVFYFKNTKKDIIKTEKDEEEYRKNNICRFCEKDIECNEVRDHFQLTGSYRGPAHSKFNLKVTQGQSNVIRFILHNFSTYDCQMFFKKLVDKKNDRVKFDIVPKANEEYVSVTYICISFIDSYRFLSSSSDSLVKTLVDTSHKTLKNFKNEIVDNDEVLDIVDEIVEEDKITKDLKKDYPDKN